MEHAPQSESFSKPEKLKKWLTEQVDTLRARLPRLLGNPKLYLAALGMAGALSEVNAQHTQYAESLVGASVNEHFFDGNLDGDDAIGAVFAPIALELNLGSEPDLKEFVVDFVYGGKQFNIAEASDSTEVAAMQETLQEKLRETMRQDFMSLYGPFLRQHIKEGYVNDWAETDFGREYLTSIKSIQITGHASPEAEKYGASALNPLSIETENLRLAEKRAAFVSDVLQKLFSEMGVSGVGVRIDVISEEDQFSPEEFSRLGDLAGQLGFGGTDSLAQIHKLLMLYNSGERDSFSEEQLEAMRQLVDSKRVVEVEITTDTGGTQKLVIPLPVLVFLSGYLLNLAFRRRKEDEPEQFEESEPTHPKRKPAPPRLIRSLEPLSPVADTRVFSESVQSVPGPTRSLEADQQTMAGMARIVAEREFGERMTNPEARERGLDYQAELSALAGEYELAALEAERQAAAQEVFGKAPLEPLAKDIQEWAFAKKNLEREERYANNLPNYGGGQEKEAAFKKRRKALAEAENNLKRRLTSAYSKYTQALATATLKAHCMPESPKPPSPELFDQYSEYQARVQAHLNEVKEIRNRFIAEQMTRSVSDVAKREALRVWEEISSGTVAAGEIQSRIDEEATKAVWGFVIPLSKEPTRAETMMTDPSIRKALAQKTATHMLQVWQDHDRSFDASRFQERESFLGQSKSEGIKLETSGTAAPLRDVDKSEVGDVIPDERESFMRLQRLRYPAAEQSIGEKEIRLRSLDYSESPEITLWGDFWAEKVAGPIVEKAIRTWTKSMREKGTSATTHRYTLEDFILGYVKQFVVEHAGEGARATEAK